MGEEYIAVSELAARLRYAPKTVNNKMHNGTWVQGIHWLKRRGSRPRFRWSAIETWLTTAEPPATDDGAAYDTEIPHARRGRPPRSLISLQNKYKGGDQPKKGSPSGVQEPGAVHRAS